MATNQQDTVIPATHRDLLEQPLIAHLATARPDGELQSNPVWFEWDRGKVKLSQTRSRQKMRNLDHDPHVAMSVTDPENPYRYVEVRGVVDRVEDDPERRFIDRLSERYMGETPYPYHQPDDERVIVTIQPVDSSTMG